MTRARAAEATLRVTSICAGAAIVLLMLVTVVDVFMRQFLTSGVRAVIEITEVSLVAVVFAGMVGAEVAGRHVRTPVVLNLLPSRPAATLRLAGLALSAVTTGWIALATANQAVQSVSNREARFGLLQVPVWPARVIIPLGMAGLCLMFVVRAVGLARRILRGEEINQNVHIEDVF
jgi:TRAP-type C4-dicarboxylate transport system permease small subunit